MNLGICGGIADITFPAVTFLHSLLQACGIRGALLWPRCKYLTLGMCWVAHQNAIFSAKRCSAEGGLVSRSEISLTCSMDSRTSCGLICAEVTPRQSVQMNFFKEEHGITNSGQSRRCAARVIIQHSCIFLRFLPGVALRVSCSLIEQQPVCFSLEVLSITEEGREQEGTFYSE